MTISFAATRPKEFDSMELNNKKTTKKLHIKNGFQPIVSMKACFPEVEIGYFKLLTKYAIISSLSTMFA